MKQVFLQSERSDDLQDVLTKPPAWYLRAGNGTILALILLGVVASTVIKYPVIVASRIQLTTENPPIRLVANTSGKLHFIAVDKATIPARQFIGYIDGTFDLKDVQHLDSLVRTFSVFIKQGNPVPDSLIVSDLQLGDIEEPYAQLREALKADQTWRELHRLENQIEFTDKKIGQYEKLNTQLALQMNLLRQELALEESKLIRNEKLLHQKVIAASDFEEIQAEFFQAKRQYETAKVTILGNNIEISDLQARKDELTKEGAQTRIQIRENIITALKRVEKDLDRLKRTHFIISPITGEVSISNFYTDNRYVVEGTELMTVVPTENEIYGQVSVSREAFQRIEIGQIVNIKLDGYPFGEFGILPGKVKQISTVPINGSYAIKVAVSSDLTTTFNQKLPFRQELSGNAEIITKDISLFRRIFFQLRGWVTHPAS